MSSGISHYSHRRRELLFPHLKWKNAFWALILNVPLPLNSWQRWLLFQRFWEMPSVPEPFFLSSSLVDIWFQYLATKRVFRFVRAKDLWAIGHVCRKQGMSKHPTECLLSASDFLPSVRTIFLYGIISKQLPMYTRAKHSLPQIPVSISIVLDPAF